MPKGLHAISNRILFRSCNDNKKYDELGSTSIWADKSLTITTFTIAMQYHNKAHQKSENARHDDNVHNRTVKQTDQR